MSGNTAACSTALSIKRLLAQRRVRARRGSDPADGIAALFDRLGLKAAQQHELGPKARPTFFLPASGLAIEVASGETPTTLAHQRLKRCAEHDEVQALLLIAPFIGQLEHTVDIGGKPAFFARIGGWP